MKELHIQNDRSQSIRIAVHDHSEYADCNHRSVYIGIVVRFVMEYARDGNPKIA